MAKGPTDKPEKRLDINKATLAQIKRVPFMNDRRAESLYNHRQRIPRFEKMEDLLKVTGISRQMLSGLKDYFHIPGGPDNDGDEVTVDNIDNTGTTA